MERRGDRGSHFRRAVGRARVLARVGRERHRRAPRDSRRASRDRAARVGDPARCGASGPRRRARRAWGLPLSHRPLAGRGRRRRHPDGPGDPLRAPRGTEHRGDDRECRDQPLARPLDRARQGAAGPLVKDHPARPVLFRCVREDDLTVGSFPPWFRRWGVGAWLVVGMALVVAAAVWLLSATSSITNPLIAGAVIAAVGGVVVDGLERKGWPRVAGAGLVTVALAAIIVLVIGLILGAISSQGSQIDSLLSHAVDRVQGWANDLGITSASNAAADIK